MLFILSKIFGYFVNRRNLRFDSGLLPVQNVGLPVISVGNLSMGGTGKTPTIHAICEIIQQMGFRPGIIGRGYKKKLRGTVVVSDGHDILSNARDAGDEMIMLAEKCRVPVIADEIKARAASEMARLFSPDCIVLDDGFQHRRLHRDLDIVILDKTTIGKPYLFPKGRLREPLDSLNRADAVLVPAGTTLDARAQNFIPGGTPVITFNTRPGEIFDANPSSKHSTSLSYPANIVAFCGIANPQRFSTSLEQKGFRIAGFLGFADHKEYSIREIKKIIKLAKKLDSRTVITTEKDRVKISEFFDIFASEDIQCCVLPIVTDFGASRDVVRSLLENVIKRNY